MESMTLDEVIAANVRALRRRDNLRVEALAAKLGIGAAVVRDMERPRTDRGQREFRWSELVALCAAFNVTLFDLVLPPAGIEIEDVRQMVTETGEPFLLLAPGQTRKTRVENVDRKSLSQHLFELVVGETDVANIDEKKRKDRLHSLTAQLVELLEEEN